MPHGKWTVRIVRAWLPLGLAYLAIVLVGSVYFVATGELEAEPGTLFRFGLAVFVSVAVVVQGRRWRRQLSR